MTIDIWSDVACPYCYIGKRHLEAALARFPHMEEVELNWRSFELDPQAPAKSPGDLYDVLSRKYGMPRQQAQEMTRGVENMGRGVGINFDFAQAVPVNTLNAHRLIHLAAEHGCKIRPKKPCSRRILRKERICQIWRFWFKLAPNWVWMLKW